MNIREALAAQGNDPLVFMGGTCGGPKWRERLCSQIKREYRWFNPVVDEWTESAQEAEKVVREEAAILLYVITPYQEGCYTFLELTEDAIQSPARTVVCFLPTFEDKAFSESQWASIVQAKCLIERHQGRVCLSLEELIDYLNTYCPEAAGNRLITPQSLSAYQPRTPSTDEPVSQLVSATQDAQAKDLTPPTTEEPGTVTATALLGQVAQEGIIDTLKSIFGKAPKQKDDKPEPERPTPSQRLDLLATARTLADVEFVREHWDAGKVTAQSWRGLSKSSHAINTDADVVGGIKEQAKRVMDVCGRLSDYRKKVTAVDRPLSRQVVEGKIDGEALQQEIIKQYGALKLPYGHGATFKTVFGDTEFRFNENKDDSSWSLREGPDVHTNDVTPERVAAFCAGYVKAYSVFETMCEQAYNIDTITLDASDQPFRAVFLNEAVTPSEKLDEICAYLCDFEGSPATELNDMAESYVDAAIRIVEDVIRAANTVTRGAGASFESLTPSSEGIVDDIVRFMKGHSTKAPEEGTDKSEHEWIMQEAQTLRKTLGNPAWVDTNYQPTATLTTNVQQALRVDGEIVKPDIGLTDGLKTLTRWIETEAKPVQQYSAQMRKIIAEAQRRFNAGDTPRSIRQYLLNEGRRLRVPTRHSPGPWMPSDTRLIFKGDRVTPEVKPPTQNLTVPELSKEDVTAAGRAIVDFVDRYLDLVELIPFVGSGCDDGFWLDDAFDTEEDDMDEIYQLYYFQADPEPAYTGFHEMLWLYINYVRAVGAWLKAHTR